jgi:hypothetical protein
MEFLYCSSSRRSRASLPCSRVSEDIPVQRSEENTMLVSRFAHDPTVNFWPRKQRISSQNDP